MASTPINIFKDKVNVEAMLNESLNQFNLIQHTFNKLSTFFALSTMLNDLFKRPDIRFNNLSVERMLKQMLKPFKRTIRPHL